MFLQLNRPEIELGSLSSSLNGMKGIAGDCAMNSQTEPNKGQPKAGICLTLPLMIPKWCLHLSRRLYKCVGLLRGNTMVVSYYGGCARGCKVFVRIPRSSPKSALLPLCSPSGGIGAKTS